MNPEQDHQGRLLAGGWQSASASHLLQIGLFQIGNCVLSVLLLAAAVLRETPEFWLNSGGYPILLREAVRWLFYPSVLACLMGLGCGFHFSLTLMRNGRRGGRFMLVTCGMQLLTLVAVLVIVIGNNLTNLQRGVPLHQHEI